MSTQTLTRTASLPRVNLLPPEIGQARRLRKLQVGLGVGVLASMGVVAALYVAAAGDVTTAQTGLESTQSQGVALQAETVKYADIPAAIAKVDAAVAQRSQAMGQEVRWSYVLNDLSLRVPSKVWLTNMTAAETVDAPVTSLPGAYPETGVGTVSFTGSAYGHNDVATWLQVLAAEKGFSQAYFSSSIEDANLEGPSGDPSVKFTSQVTVTADALSHRYDPKAGS